MRGSISLQQLAFVLLLGITTAGTGLAAGEFSRTWSFVSRSSAVVYWQLGDITRSADSWVEYGTGGQLDGRTDTLHARWSHLHRLAGLEPSTTYQYRMVAVDTSSGMRTESDLLEFTTGLDTACIPVPGDLAGPPYILDQPGAYYLLTEDITADGNALRIAADGVTLDLDGHTVTFGDDTDEQVFGVRFVYDGPATLCNGHIVQGARSGDYSCAIRSNGRPYPTEIFGITTDVHLKCAYPVNFHSQASGVEIHHNHFYSRVTELESRHYPGNAILRMYITGPGIRIHDNLLTEGCHRGMDIRDGVGDVVINNNDIRHHQQYVNGYAIIPPAGAEVHHNKVTSTGRGMHLSDDGISVHDNHLDIKGHMHLSDLPANTRPFHHRLIELHGIKFEGEGTTNCKVFNNYVRVIQHLPEDSLGYGLPENKIRNGVYVRGTPTSSTSSTLIDDSRNWEQDRWKNYFLRYSPDFEPARIGGNDAASVIAYMEGAPTDEYSIYMKWQYVPGTPLNIACYSPNAMNEVYDNTFIALTHYPTSHIWHGGYGETGNWASPIMLVSMDRGAASSGLYSIYVHNNRFISNDLFINSYDAVNMTVRIEDNTFTLASSPHQVERTSRLRNLGTTLETSVMDGNNDFQDGGGGGADINGDGRQSVRDVLDLLLLGLHYPDSPRCDWNVDGRFTTDDVIGLIQYMMASGDTGLLASIASRPAARDDGPGIPAKELFAMEADGRDGL